MRFGYWQSINQSINLYFLPMEIIDIYNYNDANKIQMKRNNVRTYIHPTGIHILGWYMYTCVFSNTHFLLLYVY